MKIVVDLAQKHICPGSLVLVNDNALPDIGDALADTHAYEAVTSLHSLLHANSDGHQSTKSILGS